MSVTLMKNRVKVGGVYNHYTALERSGPRHWKVQCVCGKVRILGTGDTGRKKSCGCRRKDAYSNNQRCRDLTGQRFGDLIAKEITSQRSSGSPVWFCECDCGE